VIPGLATGESAEDRWPVRSDIDWVMTEYVNNKPDPALLADVDVFVGTDFSPEMGAAARSLKAILIPAAGFDRVVPSAVPPGVVVANAYHHEAPIAEWVMAVAVALDHELLASVRTFRNGDWSQWPQRHGPYRELFGRTFGIIGYGAIGRRVAKLANAYDMRVMAAGRRAETAAEAEADNVEYGAGQEAMEKVLATADFVLVSTPLVEATHGLIGEREIGLMRPDAYLINPARGHIIDEKALYDALAGGLIAGAAIDTWYEYPVGADDSPRPSRFPFWELDNVIMTPHHSGATVGTSTRRAATTAANIDRLANGEPLVNVIDELSTL
jgi:phosphoglycerate dehydrogenase-like enzyme